MPRGRPPKHTDHPLFQLRELIGKGSPITQPELARITDIPLATLQSIEAGRRNLTVSTHIKIMYALGARWDHQTKQWLGQIPGRSDPPYSRELYLEHRQIFTVRPHSHERKVSDLTSRLKRLFLNIQDKDWYRLFFLVDDFIERCEAEFETETQSKTPTLSEKHAPGKKRMYGPPDD